MNPLDHHTKIALAFSGGKDSTACVYLLKDRLDDITIYHVDAGDMLPEMRDGVARVEAFAPHFVRINTDVAGWIAENGLPSDLVPYASHPIGRACGQARTPLVSRYDCCFANLMWPLVKRVHEDGNTLLIRGVKKSDLPRLPAVSGDVIEGSAIEIYHPIEDWSDEQVFSFLALQGVQLPRFYEQHTQGLDCARCSGWWSERRGAYLKQYYPELWAEYDARLQLVINEIAGPLAQLKHEAEVT